MMISSITKILDFIGFKDYKDYGIDGERFTYYKKYMHHKNVLVKENGDILYLQKLTLEELSQLRPIEVLHNKVYDKEIEEASKLNKYNLKPNDIKKAIVVSPERLKLKPFWRNELINAWCLSEGAGRGFGGSWIDSYWIGFKDDGKIDYHILCWEGMGNYAIKEFFKSNDIECRSDLDIQIKYVKMLNWLIEENIIKIGGINGK